MFFNWSAGRRRYPARRRLVPRVETLESRDLLATVAVNVGQVVRPVNAQLLGVNVNWWDTSLNTSQTQQMVQAAGLTLYRFPGGSSSDDFHFNAPATYGGEGTAASMASFIASVNGGGLVTLDYGSGSPQEAAAFLAYLNGAVGNTTVLGMGQEWSDSSNSWSLVDWKTAGYWASLRAAAPLAQDDGLNFLRLGRTAPFGFHYFEVGNEEYGSWEIDHHGQGGDPGQPHDPATYVAFARQFAGFAAQIDRSITIGVDTGSPGGDYNNWIANVLQEGVNQGFVPGFLSDHNYMQAPGSESDSTLLLNTVSNPSGQSATDPLDWALRAADYRQLLNSVLGTAAGQVQLLVTEFNSVYSNPGKQSTSLVNGLFVADSLGSLLETEYNAGIVWDLRDGWNTGNNNSSSLYGWRQGGDYGLLGQSSGPAPSTGTYIPYPSYFAEQLVSMMVQPEGAVVQASSNDPNLSVYAVQEATGHLDLLVINKNATTALAGQFQITGFQPGTQAQVWQYGEAQDTAQSQTTNGQAALANFTSSLTVSGASFSYTFPSYSMTVLDVAPSGGNQPPTVAAAAAASPNPVSGTTTALNVLGADDGGEANLTYTWATSGTPPAPVHFSINGSNVAQATTATFTKTGTYTLQATVSDAGGLNATSSVTVTVVSLTNATLNLDNAGNLTYTVSAGVPDHLTVGLSGGNYTLTDTAAIIAVTGTGAGFVSGGGTSSVTIPAADVAHVTLDTNDGIDTITILNDAAPITITADSGGAPVINLGDPTANTTISGTITNQGNGPLLISGSGNTLIPGNLVSQGTGGVDILGTGTVTISGNVNLGAGNLSDSSSGQATISGVVSATSSGLLEGQIPGNIDTTDPPNPAYGTDVVLTTKMAESTTGSNNNVATPFPTGKHTWTNNDTWIYSGQIFIGNTNGNGTGTVSFAKNVDDSAYLKIDGTVYLNDGGWNNPLGTGPITLATGWHAIDVRFANGGQGAGPSGQNNNGWTGWTTAIGFVYRVDTSPADPKGSSKKVADYVIPTDNGSGNLFRVSAVPRVVMNGTGTLTLGGPNTYLGPTIINSGTLIAANSNALNPAGGMAVTVNSGGALALAAAGGIALPTGNPITISGNGPAGNGAIENLGGTNAIAAPITLAGEATIGSDAGLLTLSGNLTQNEPLTFTGGGNTTVSGIISGTATTPGLVESQSSTPGSQALDTTSAVGNDPAAGTDIVSTTVMANSNANNNASPPNPTSQHVWGNDDTWFYQGQIFLTSGATYQFFESVDDSSYLKIDNNVLFNGGAWGQTTSTITGDGQWHTFDARFFNGAGGAGPVANQGSIGANPGGFFVSINGGTFAPLVDNGSGNLFRTPNSLSKNGLGTLTLANANTYTGSTTINGGTLQVSSDAGLGVSGGVVNLNGGTLEVTTSFATTRPFAVGANNGTLQVDSAGATAQILTFSGPLTGGGALVKTGTGTFTLLGGGAYSYTGPTTVAAGKLQVDGTVSASTATVGNGAILSGSGTVHGINAASGGTVSPGDSPGTLSTSNFSMAGGATLQEEIGGTPAGSQYDQVVITSGGTIALTNATLNIVYVNNFLPQVGQSYTIINNQGTNAVTGTFAQGSTYSANGYVYSIGYAGGIKNNSVVLTVTAVPGPVTHFSVVASPASVVTHAPGAVSFTVTALDANGNVVPTYNGTVHFTSSDSVAAFTTSSYTFTTAAGGGTPGLDYGAHTFTSYATLITVGNQTLNVADSSIAGSSSASTAVTVTPGPFNKYVVTLPNGSSVTAGSGFEFIVQATDQYGNAIPAASYTGPGTIALTTNPSTGMGSFPNSLNQYIPGLFFNSGTLTVAGTYTITATGTQGLNTYTGTSATLTVTPAAVSYFTFSTPASVTTGIPFNVTVTARDFYGNTVTGYSGTVQLSSTDPAAKLGAALLPTTFSFPLNNGTDTLTNISLNTSGNQKFIATDTVAANLPITGTSSTVDAIGLQVTQVTPTATGFTVNFNEPFLLSSLHLYGSGTTTPPDLRFYSETIGAALTGSLVVNAAHTGFTFVETTTVDVLGALPDGSYIVSVLSSPAGLTDTNGLPLDTNNNTDFVDNQYAPRPAYTTTFTLNTLTAFDNTGAQVALSVPAFAQGPGAVWQTPSGSPPVGYVSGIPGFVNVQQQGSNPVSFYGGLPAILSDGNHTTTASFQVTYNTALLTVTGAQPDATTQASYPSATFTRTAGTPVGGLETDTFTFNTHGAPLTSGQPWTLGELLATVPNASGQTIYHGKELLPISTISVDGGSTHPVIGGPGFQVVAYLGDGSGDGQLTTTDAALANNVDLGHDTGFAAYPLVDPVVLADTDANNAVDGTTVSNLAFIGSGHTLVDIPGVPAGAQVAVAAPDPDLGVPSRVTVSNGVVSVPVTIDNAKPAGSTGLTEATLALKYDPQVLSVTAADVHLGNIPGLGTGWTETALVDQTTGQIAIELYSLTPISQSVAGSLVTVDFHLLSGASRPATIQLVNAANPGGGRWFNTNLADTNGALVLGPGTGVVNVTEEAAPRAASPIVVNPIVSAETVPALPVSDSSAAPALSEPARLSGAAILAGEDGSGPMFLVQGVPQGAPGLSLPGGTLAFPRLMEQVLLGQIPKGTIPAMPTGLGALLWDANDLNADWLPDLARDGQARGDQIGWTADSQSFRDLPPANDTARVEYFARVGGELE